MTDDTITDTYMYVVSISRLLWWNDNFATNYYYTHEATFLIESLYNNGVMKEKCNYVHGLYHGLYHESYESGYRNNQNDQNCNHVSNLYGSISWWLFDGKSFMWSCV